MNRRSFLLTSVLAAAGAAFDPERLLWVPNAKRFILPPATGWGSYVTVYNTFGKAVAKTRIPAIEDGRFSVVFPQATSNWGTIATARLESPRMPRVEVRLQEWVYAATNTTLRLDCTIRTS